MQKKLLLYISILGILFSSACKKATDDNNPSPGSGTTLNAFLTAKTDGVPFVAKTYSAVKTSSGALVITGSDDDGRTIRLFVDSLATGDRTLKMNGFNEGTYGVASNQMFYSSADIQTMNNGHIIISYISSAAKTISGSFNFHSVNLFDNSTAIISEGLFNQIPYVDSSAISTSTGLTLFPFAGVNVQINGVTFNPQQAIAMKLDSIIQISALRDNGGKVITIRMPSDVVPGTYLVNSTATNANSYFVAYTENNANYVTTSGTMTILSHDPVKRSIKGIFHMVAKDFNTNPQPDLNFDNGAFYVVYYQ